MKLTNFDAAQYLDSPDRIAAYLDAALAENDIDFFLKALGTVAKAKGMSQIAKETGLGRQNLYKALSGETTPRLDTVQKIIETLGASLSVKPN